jgi:hypothetical protein
MTDRAYELERKKEVQPSEFGDEWCRFVLMAKNYRRTLVASVRARTEEKSTTI